MAIDAGVHLDWDEQKEEGQVKQFFLFYLSLRLLVRTMRPIGLWVLPLLFVDMMIVVGADSMHSLGRAVPEDHGEKYREFQLEERIMKDDIRLNRINLVLSK